MRGAPGNRPRRLARLAYGGRGTRARAWPGGLRIPSTLSQEQIMSRFALALTVLAVALPGAARAEAKAKPAPVIDLVLCLDVSSSMNDLIDSAKVKLWDLVNELAAVKPTPRLRVGLYSYGHRDYDAKKGWVRKEVDLTGDLDAVYRK